MNIENKILIKDKEIIKYILNLLNFVDNVSVNNIFIQSAYTSSLYSIGINNTKLALKISQSKLINITVKNNINIVSNFIEREYKDLQKIIILPIKIGNFKDILYEILPFANGKSINSIFTEYLEQKINIDYLMKCFFELGNNIAYMHYTGKTKDVSYLHDMKTSLIHKDLHGENIFYSVENGIKLIDIDGFIDSINQPSGVERDLYYLFLQTINIFMLFTVCSEVYDITRKEYIKAVESFLIGYKTQMKGINCYPCILSLFKQTTDLIYNSKENIGSLISIVQKEEIIDEILGKVFLEDTVII